MLDAFATDLNRAETTLAGVKNQDVKLRLRLSEIKFDFVGNGKNQTPLIEVLTKLNNGRPFNFQNRNPEFRIHFDRGDVAWLRAYCNFLAAMVNGYRAVDEELGFDNRMRHVFPKIEGAKDAAEPDWLNVGLSIKDAPRLRRLRLQLVAVCELNQETWNFIRAESDDDFEWLSNSKQTEQIGLPLTDQQIAAWLSMMKELGRLLEGKSLMPGELLVWFGGKNYEGLGLNVQKVLDDPPHDLLNLKRIQEQGIDKKYLENAKDKPRFDVGVLFQALQLFEGPFGWARAIRLN